jgi:thiol-disulfide isomerase/thioredoxin
MGSLDVWKEKDIPALERMIVEGPLTLVFVHAEWCGHCDTFKKKIWNNVSQMPNKTINTASVHYDMVENTSLANAKIDGYPSLLLVGTDKKAADFVSPDGKPTNAIPQPKSKEELERLLTASIPEPVKNANSVKSELFPSAAAPVSTPAAPSVPLPTLPPKTNAVPLPTLPPKPLPSPPVSTRSYAPAPVETLEGPPDVLTDLVQTQKLETQPLQRGGGKRGGGLMESLLKITGEAAHAGVLLATAAEYARRSKKTRRASKRSKKTLRKRKTRAA